MRWFWGAVLLAVLATAIIIVVSRTSTVPPTPQPAPVVAPVPPAPAPPTPAAPTLPAPSETPASTPPASPEPPAASGEVRPIAEAAPQGGVSPTPVDPAADMPTDAATPKPAVAADALAASPVAETTFPGPPTPAEAEALALSLDLNAALGIDDPLAAVGGGVTTAPAPGAIPDSAAAAPAADPAAKAKLTPREDGSVLVDDRFIMKGAGTRTDPYVITWEQLVSSQETYQPRLGRKIIPDRVQMLDGKWVRISGFIAFPILAQSTDEMLMMLNQWDGCCIGVPPTPYDAIEVKLKEPAKGDDRLRVSGSVTGILRVDPYLVKDWLVSLYLMDDAELAVDAGGAKREEGAIGSHQPPQ